MTISLPFYRTRRSALVAGFLHARQIAERGQMRAVPVKSDPGTDEVRQKSSEMFLTDAERLHHAGVLQKLRIGTLYQKDANEPTPDSGGLERERIARKQEQQQDAVHLSDTQFRVATIKWADKTVVSNCSVNVDLFRGWKDDWPTITTPDGRTIPDPDIVRCSFCRVFLPRNQATTGRGPLRKSTKIETEWIGNQKVMREVVKHWSSKLVACKDCCLLIRPTVHKDGSITNNVDFPVMD